MTKCIICDHPTQIHPSQRDTAFIECPQCGKYHITDTLRATWQNYASKSHLISYYVRNQNDIGGEPPLLTDFEVEKIIKIPELPLVEKIDALLMAYAEDLKNYTDSVEVSNPKYIAKIAAKSREDCQFVYSKVLVEKKYLSTKNGQDFKITPEGWIHCESLLKNKDSRQGFVAMWFDESMNFIYDNAIAPAIEDADFKPRRIDKKEHINKVDDEIIAEIQRSRFVIADFTGHRGGVYFEAGYAMGRGIPVIWTCKACCMSELHFDIRQYNMIDWKDEADLKKRLHFRIVALNGEQK